MQRKNARILESFDAGLWKAGVADGAFSGLRDPGARWFTLEDGGRKVALASAVPGPGDLTSVSYFVLNEERGKGYATALASEVAGRFEKASFLVMKNNEASVKTALKALGSKFSMVMGRGAVRLTKEAADKIPGGKADKKKPSDFDPKALADGAKHELEHTSDPAVAREIAMDHLTEDPAYYEKLEKVEKKASGNSRNTVGTTLEGKIHESFTTTADRMYQAGMMSTKERIELSGTIGRVLEQFRRGANRDVSSREMTDRAHELLKKALEVSAPTVDAHAAPPPYLAAQGNVISPELRRKRAVKVAYELLKSAISVKNLRRASEARAIQLQLKGIQSGKALQGKIDRASARVALEPTTPAARSEVRAAARSARMVAGARPRGEKGGDLYRAIRDAEKNQSHQPGLKGGGP